MQTTDLKRLGELPPIGFSPLFRNGVLRLRVRTITLTLNLCISSFLKDAHFLLVHREYSKIAEKGEREGKRERDEAHVSLPICTLTFISIRI